jgi:hypothetical protein
MVARAMIDADRASADQTARPDAPPPTDGRFLVVALVVMLFPPLLIAFLLVMERVEEPLRRPASAREVAEFLDSASPGEVDTLTQSGIRRAVGRWRRRRHRSGTTNPPLV